jgi:O-antigen ligase
MPTILAIAALFLLATDALNIELSVLPGLSAKNLLIYMVATLVALRMVVGRQTIMDAGKMQGVFLVLILYATITWLVAFLVVDYPRYDVVESAIRLKAGLIDHLIFFLVFLFGVRDADDAVKVVKWLLLGALFANALTILDALGYVDIGFKIREDGRTTGAIGESNQYAAFIVMMLPATIAAAVGSRGMMRLFWLGAALVSGFALAMTASRGGFVGLAIAIAVGAYLYRHLISYSRAAAWGLGMLAVLTIFIALSPYGGLLAERMIGQSGAVGMDEVSSGRSQIWMTALRTMFEHPLTFITGFGWDVYNAMPFNYSPHNHYLSLWFNLGLVGLFCGTYLLVTAINRARRASEHAKPPYRAQLIAFVIGGVGVAAAVFFVDLHKPWLYFWMYAGLVMRLALCTSEQTEAVKAPRERTTLLKGNVSGPKRDSFGWVHSGSRT